jgi:hypothetical protein
MSLWKQILLYIATFVLMAVGLYVSFPVSQVSLLKIATGVMAVLWIFSYVVGSWFAGLIYNFCLLVNPGLLSLRLLTLRSRYPWYRCAGLLGLVLTMVVCFKILDLLPPIPVNGGVPLMTWGLFWTGLKLLALCYVPPLWALLTVKLITRAAWPKVAAFCPPSASGSGDRPRH